MAITPDQRERRKQGIFASDIARIMTGKSVPLVLEKMGEKEPEDYEDNLEVEVGALIEDKILDAYEAERPNISLIRDSNALEFFHKEFGWLGCHPDARAMYPYQTIGVEVKAIGDYNRKYWGDGGDEVPESILWQALGQMAVTEDAVTEIPVCFLNVAALKMLLTSRIPPITIFRVEADKDLQEYIIQRCQEIWTCIQTRELPAAETLLDVQLLYRKDSGRVIEADEETFALYKRLMRARRLKDAFSEREDQIALTLKSIMEDASELRYENQRLITWKKDKDSEQLDKNAIIERYPKATKKFLKPRLGARKFLPKELKQETK